MIKSAKISLILLFLSIISFNFMVSGLDNRNNLIINSTNQIDIKKHKTDILKKCKFIHRDNFINLDTSMFKLMITECDRWSVPYSIYFSNIDKESGFRFIKNSQGSNAFGFNQIMPKTFKSYAKRLKLKGGHTPENDIKVSAFMLHDMHRKWKKRVHNDKKAWMWTIAEYEVGIASIIEKDSLGKSFYRFPDSNAVSIHKVLRNY